jgi:hypothetical protein
MAFFFPFWIELLNEASKLHHYISNFFLFDFRGLFSHFLHPLSLCIMAIYNSKALKRARMACPVHRVDSAHNTLYRGNLIKGGEYIMVQRFCPVQDNTILIKNVSLSLLICYFSLKSEYTIKCVVLRTGCPISPRRN